MEYQIVSIITGIIALIVGLFQFYELIVSKTSFAKKSLVSKYINPKFLDIFWYFISSIILFVIFCLIFILNYKWFNYPYIDIFSMLIFFFYMFNIINLDIINNKKYFKRNANYKNKISSFKFYKKKQLLEFTHIIILNFVFSNMVINMLVNYENFIGSKIVEESINIIIFYVVCIFVLILYLLYLLMNFKKIYFHFKPMVHVKVFYNNGNNDVCGTDIIEGKDYYDLSDGFEDGHEEYIYKMRLKKTTVNDILIKINKRN